MRAKLGHRSALTVLVLVLGLTLVVGLNPAWAGSRQVTVRLWGHSNPAFVAANEALIKEFEKENPDIRINYETFPYDNFVPKLQTAFASGTEADVVEMFGMWVEPYAKAGRLDAVPSSVMSAQEIENTYFQAPLSGFEYNGKYYGFPREFNLENGGMIVNKKIFDAAEIKSYPKTWDEVIEVAKKLTKVDGRKIVQSGFHFIQGDPVTFLYLSLILQQGGNYWANDKVHVKFTTPEGYRAMQFMVDFVLKHKVVSPELPKASPAFFQGIVAMYPRGPWIMGVAKQDYPQMSVEYVPLPSFGTTPPYFAAESGWGIVVSSRSKVKDAAWKFARFMASKDASRAWNIKTFTIPAYKELATDPELLKAMSPIKVSFDVLKYGRFIGPLQNRDRFFEIIFNRFSEAAFGKISSEQAVKLIEKDLNSMIDEYVK
ncbi:MAG TPA: ABC transporter substrate-binding protein [Firmicutes bacterium]|nr:ABC transporter substrate-binding protein [Bacillota bacterium]